MMKKRYSTKKENEWIGSRSYFTKTCDGAQVHTIIHVETTLAPVPEIETPLTMHSPLAEKALLLRNYFLDAGYLDVDILVNAKQDYDINICDSVLEKVSRQAKEDIGFDLAYFLIDWEHRFVTCTAGHTSQH